jgi:hypothetical protein
MMVYLHAFLTSALDGGELSASRLGRFTPGERVPCYPLDRKQGGPQSRLDAAARGKYPFLILPRINPLPSTLQLVTILNELSG